MQPGVKSAGRGANGLIYAIYQHFDICYNRCNISCCDGNDNKLAHSPALTRERAARRQGLYAGGDVGRYLRFCRGNVDVFRFSGTGDTDRESGQ